MTGGYVYHGTRFPELAGAYIYGDYQTGTVWSLRARGDAVVEHRELARTPLHLVAFGEDREGELYLLDHDRTHQIYRLVRNPAAKGRATSPGGSARPGCSPRPATIGRPRSDPLCRQRRALGRRRDGRAVPRGARRGPRPPRRARQLAIPRGLRAGPHRLRRGRRLSHRARRRVETQLLHFQDDAWRPYSYVWDDDQADAASPMPGAPSGRSPSTSRAGTGDARGITASMPGPSASSATTPGSRRRRGLRRASASPLGVNTPQMRSHSGRSTSLCRRLWAGSYVRTRGLRSWRERLPLGGERRERRPVGLPRLGEDSLDVLLHRPRRQVEPGQRSPGLVIPSARSASTSISRRVSSTRP